MKMKIYEERLFKMREERETKKRQEENKKRREMGSEEKRTEEERRKLEKEKQEHHSYLKELFQTLRATTTNVAPPNLPSDTNTLANLVKEQAKASQEKITQLAAK